MTREERDHFVHALSHAFVWALTPQGYKFWSSLRDYVEHIDAVQPDLPSSYTSSQSKDTHVCFPYWVEAFSIALKNAVNESGSFWWEVVEGLMSVLRHSDNVLMEE